MKGSRLLIDEPALQVLPSLACELGLNEAMFIQQLHFWLKSKHAKEFDGRSWVYNTYEGWHEQFPFWSVATIKRVITSCERRGVVESSTEFNRRSGDRTKWYTLDYEGLEIEDPQTKSSEQEVNLTRATDQSDPTQEVNLTRALPENTQRVTTETTVVEDPQTKTTEALPDDETSRSLLLLSKVKGFPRDQGENALYLAELRSEFPDVAASEVCRQYAIWHRDNPNKTKNHRGRLRNFFKQADKPRATSRASPGSSPSLNGAGHSKAATAERRQEGYEWLFD